MPPCSAFRRFESVTGGAVIGGKASEPFRSSFEFWSQPKVSHYCFCFPFLLSRRPSSFILLYVSLSLTHTQYPCVASRRTGWLDLLVDSLFSPSSAPITQHTLTPATPAEERDGLAKRSRRRRPTCAFLSGSLSFSLSLQVSQSQSSKCLLRLFSVWPIRTRCMPPRRISWYTSCCNIHTQASKHADTAARSRDPKTPCRRELASRRRGDCCRQRYARLV